MHNLTKEDYVAQYDTQIAAMEQQEDSQWQQKMEYKRKLRGDKAVENNGRNQKSDIEAVEYEDDGVTIKQRELGPVLNEYGQQVYEGKEFRDKVLDEMIVT